MCVPPPPGWFLASCCSSGSSEGPTLLMRRSTVWQHPVVISATRLRSTPPNWSPQQPIGIWANHTTLKHSRAGQRKTISNGLWATDTVGEKLLASLNNGHSQKRKHIQNIYHICHRSWWERDTVLQKQIENLGPSSRLLITDCPAVRITFKCESWRILISGKNFGDESNFGLSS